jgi:hypothetical protein
VLVLLAAIAWWQGEDVKDPMGAIVITTCVAIVSAIVLGLLGGRSRWMGAVWVVGALLVAATAHASASKLATNAFNDCVNHAEEVRTALARFHDQHGRYPEDLSALSGIHVPGHRWLRPNLLQYEAVPPGYELGFSDWLVAFAASDQRGFEAHK